MVGAHLVTRERDVPLYHDRAPCHRPEGDLSAVRLLVAAPSHREPVALPQLVEDEQARVGRYVRVGARAVEERQRRAVERHDRRVNLRLGGRRVVEALEFLGAPLSAEKQAALATAAVTVATVWALSATPLHAQPAELEGVKLAPTVQVASAPLVLNGAGLRTRAFFKVYVAALYGPQKATDAAALLEFVMNTGILMWSSDR